MVVRELYSHNACSASIPMFTNISPNNCAISHNGVAVLITTVNDDGLVSVYKLTLCKDLYDYPYPSSTLGIGYYRKTSLTLTDIKPQVKAMCIPVGSEFLVIPFAC